jgi:hypothetical protein
VWKRSVQSIVREALLREREVQAASDKAACWRSLRNDVLKDLLLMVLLLDRVVLDSAAMGGGGNVGAGKLPKGVPPLFSLQSPLKSSKEVRPSMLTLR